MRQQDDLQKDIDKLQNSGNPKTRQKVVLTGSPMGITYSFVDVLTKEGQLLKDKEQELQDMEWNKQSYNESYTMYLDLANQLETHYKAGLIKESEYLSALSNAKNYKVKLISNLIDFIIYNNELQSLFVAD